MAYIVNKTHDDLRLPTIGRVLPAGARSDQIENPVSLSDEQAAELAQNPNLAAFNDGGTELQAEVTDWSRPKTIVLDPTAFPLSHVETEVPAEVPSVTSSATVVPTGPTTQQTVDVPTGEHVEIVPDAPNGAQQ